MNTKMILCKSCGKEISENAKVCPNCGCKNNKPIYKKYWFWLIAVIAIIIIFTIIGGDDTENKENTNNSSADISSSEKINTDNEDNSVAELYKLIATNTEDDINISDDSIKFMNEHENFFPGNESISGTMSDYVNFEVDYAHLSKNISKYDDKMISVSGTVVDIEEAEDGSLTYIHIMDYDDNSYVLYYLGTLDEIFEDTEVSAYALPFSIITFENLSGAYTEAVAGAGCLFEAAEY